MGGGEIAKNPIDTHTHTQVDGQKHGGVASHIKGQTHICDRRSWHSTPVSYWLFISGTTVSLALTLLSRQACQLHTRTNREKKGQKGKEFNTDFGRQIKFFSDVVG